MPKTKRMDKDQIKAEFNEFIDTASESTLRDFVKYMKARRKSKAEIDAKIRQVLEDTDNDDNSK